MNARARGDLASSVLGLATHLLPDSRRDWGAAMQAELAHVGSGRARRRFALGCLRAAALQPNGLRVVGYPVLGAVAVAGGVILSAGIAYAPARIAVVLVMALLVAVALLGRSGRLLGPVHADPVHRWVRALALLVVAGSMGQVVVELRGWSNNNPASMVVYAGVIGTVLLGQVVVAQCLTGRRAGVGRAALVGGLGLGLLAAAVWAATAQLGPPLPASGAGAVLLVVVASGVATVLVARRTHDPRQGLIALLGVWVSGLSVAFGAAMAMIHLQPERIPDIVGPVMVPTAMAADRLRENAIEIVDGYVPLPILGGLAALCLIAVILSGRAARAPRQLPAQPELVAPAPAQ